ncbi:mandelate racemase/muconate lactonizing enzyme family protein, partial [Candidatus Omnitrophota bacterium]
VRVTASSSRTRQRTLSMIYAGGWMSATVKKIEILQVELPFKKVFKHASHERCSSNSVFIKIYLDGGVIGYGEALPREYVTGESPGMVYTKLQYDLLQGLIGAEFSSIKDASDFIERFEGLDGPCKCATELALFDAVGKYYGESVCSFLGERVAGEVFYSGVISAGSTASAALDALKLKLYGFKQVKIKVGLQDDLERLRAIRRILGENIDIRVDANCAWNTEEAIENINMMREFAISAVEQPVKGDDIAGLKKVTDSVQETVIADESLCTIDDAQRLASERACNMFNIRLSKCGGLTNALKIADIARQNGIKCQLGCQVGESGVLSAAGRHFACCVSGIDYLEGSYGRFLLKEDVTKEDTTFSRRGRAGALKGPGLGVNVADEVLDRYTVNRAVVE